jgi:hypothetical protein
MEWTSQPTVRCLAEGGSMITSLALAIMRWYVRIFGQDRTLLAVAMACPVITDEDMQNMFRLVE